MPSEPEKSIELFCPKCLKFAECVLDAGDHHKHVCTICGASYTLQESNVVLLAFFAI